MKRIFTLILALCMLFSTSAVLADGVLNEVVSKEETELYGVGETANVRSMSITMDAIYESSGDSETGLPDDGNIFLICEVTMENNGEDLVIATSERCFEMKCDGKPYELSQKGLDAARKADKLRFKGAMEKGEKARGIVAYEVPKNWEHFELKVTPEPVLYSAYYAVFVPEKPETTTGEQVSDPNITCETQTEWSVYGQEFILSGDETRTLETEAGTYTFDSRGGCYKN